MWQRAESRTEVSWVRDIYACWPWRVTSRKTVPYVAIIQARRMGKRASSRWREILLFLWSEGRKGAWVTRRSCLTERLPQHQGQQEKTVSSPWESPVPQQFLTASKPAGRPEIRKPGHLLTFLSSMFQEPFEPCKLCGLPDSRESLPPLTGGGVSV